MNVCEFLAVFPLLYAAITDISARRIPNMTVAMISVCAVANILAGHISPWVSLAGGGVIGVVTILSGTDGIGGGDIKLAVALGTLYGFPVSVFIMLAAVALMITWGLAKRKTVMPFAPFALIAVLAYDLMATFL